MLSDTIILQKNYKNILSQTKTKQNYTFSVVYEAELWRD